jgi:hypothetical protein
MGRTTAVAAAPIASLQFLLAISEYEIAMNRITKIPLRVLFMGIPLNQNEGNKIVVDQCGQAQPARPALVSSAKILKQFNITKDRRLVGWQRLSRRLRQHLASGSLR